MSGTFYRQGETTIRQDGANCAVVHSTGTFRIANGELTAKWSSGFQSRSELRFGNAVDDHEVAFGSPTSMPFNTNVFAPNVNRYRFGFTTVGDGMTSAYVQLEWRLQIEGDPVSQFVQPCVEPPVR